MSKAKDIYRMIEDNGDTSAWYMKGNHELDEIIEGIEWENGLEYWEDEELDKNTLKVIHKYLRCVPVSPLDDLPFSHYLLDSKKGRGAFEVSIVYVD